MFFYPYQMVCERTINEIELNYLYLYKKRLNYNSYKKRLNYNSFFSNIIPKCLLRRGLIGLGESSNGRRHYQMPS